MIQVGPVVVPGDDGLMIWWCVIRIPLNHPLTIVLLSSNIAIPFAIWDMFQRAGGGGSDRDKLRATSRHVSLYVGIPEYTQTPWSLQRQLLSSSYTDSIPCKRPYKIPSTRDWSITHSLQRWDSTKNASYQIDVVFLFWRIYYTAVTSTE